MQSRHDLLRPRVLIHPNPASHTLGILLISPEQIPIEIQSVEVYDLKGLPMLSQSVNGERVAIAVKTLQSGIYALRIVDKEGNPYQQKFTVVR